MTEPSACQPPDGTIPAELLRTMLLKAIGGQHLASWLPGADRTAAIAAAVASRAGWSDADGTWGQVTRYGMWPGPPAPATGKCRRGDAVAFLTWPEVLIKLRATAPNPLREEPSCPAAPPERTELARLLS
jgi:hypothetical protein